MKDPHPQVVTFLSHVARLGGAERSMLDVVRALDRERFVPRAVLPGDGELTAALDRADVPIDFCSSLRPLRRRASASRRAAELASLAMGSFRMKRIVQATRPAVVHANSTTAALFAAWSGVRKHSRLIWHLRDLVPLGRVGRTLGKRIDAVVATSRSVAALAHDHTDPSRIELIPNGVDTAYFGEPISTESARTELALGDGMVFCTIGQAVPWKRYDLLFDAVAILCARGAKPLFLIVEGDDVEGGRAALEHSVRERELDDFVRIEKRQADIRPYLAAADLLLHPAFPEPFGRVVVEAMAAGLPVVCLGGDHGPAETIRDGVDGVHVPSFEPRDFADAVLALMADPNKRYEMAARGRRRARDLFDHRRMATRCMELYDVVIQGNDKR